MGAMVTKEGLRATAPFWKKEERFMKKKLAAVVFAAMLMLALPVTAWAAPTDQFNSPTQSAIATNDASGASLYVKGNNITFGQGSRIVVTDVTTSAQASNVPAGANVLASFEVTTEGDVSFDSLTFTFNVGTQYAGYAATVYIQHNDGTTETKDVVIASDGTFTLTVEKLSIYSVVLGDKVEDLAAADTSATSPKTGVDTTAVAGGVAVALAGAACVAFALRRKINE